MENKAHYTVEEIYRLMRMFNDEHGYTTKGTDEHITAVAVIKQSSFSKPYTETERSYKFTNDNKAFIAGQLGYSIFADCLDGVDLGVRLERYIEGGGWEVDYCYLLDE